jgi:aspartate racemase
MSKPRLLGLIGGLSWYSTSIYYQTINRLVNERLGSSHSARILLYSVDFEEFRLLQNKDDWPGVLAMLLHIAKLLEEDGAECVMLCTNTPHLVADEIRQNINVPLIHIAEVTAQAIVEAGLKNVGLVGTKFTMENPFFRDRLRHFGVDSIVPSEADRDYIHASIFNELTRGHFKEGTKSEYVEIINRLQAAGAQGVIFGCTEISILVKPENSRLPIFDTTVIHSRAAVDFALS